MLQQPGHTLSSGMATVRSLQGPAPRRLRQHLVLCAASLCGSSLPSRGAPSPTGSQQAMECNAKLQCPEQLLLATCWADAGAALRGTEVTCISADHSLAASELACKPASANENLLS